MGVGEIANFSAYIFSPASLVTPLGALSVVFTCILSTYFLNERMNILAQLGVVLATLGSFFVVVHAPQQEVITSIRVLYEDYFSKWPFIVYAIVQLGLMIVLLFFQTRHFFVRVLLSSFGGAFCVMATKGVGTGVAGIADGGLDVVLRDWFFYVLLVGLILSIGFQMIQVTKALDMADASTVMPIFYVTFTIVWRQRDFFLKN